MKHAGTQTTRDVMVDILSVVGITRRHTVGRHRASELISRTRASAATAPAVLATETGTVS